MPTTIKKYDFNGRIEYIDKDVLASAPIGLYDDVVFFKVGRDISSQELADEYEKRSLIPATIETLCAWDKKKLMEDFICTQWKDSKGNWCYATFGHWGGGRGVDVGRYAVAWRDPWWFAGVRKSSAKKSKAKCSSAAQPLDLAIEQVKKAGYVVYKQM